MSILDKITQGDHRIVQDKRSKLWFQLSEIVALSGARTQDMSDFRAIELSEINPYIWFSVITGENIISNEYMALYTDKNFF